MPPSLRLPVPVTDLAAVRTGNQVALTWTMPKKSTDKLLLKGSIPVRLCRKEGSGVCEPVGGGLQLPPGAEGAFTDVLPSALAAGKPRPLAYCVELANRNGRSAGRSNDAVVLAGQAPQPVSGLAASVRKDGVLLRWTPDRDPSVIRLHRKLLSPQPGNAAEARPKPSTSLMASPPEPIEKNLLVDAATPDRVTDRALDKEIRFGQVYEYRAQRVARVVQGGQTLELAGELSAPVRVETRDVFPPEAPTGLAAVATTAQADGEASIDLSWQPGADVGLAGYRVYRREADKPEQAWQRISPAEPLAAPAFRDPTVQPGHPYRYAVSALGQNGQESVRSAETEETVPAP
jgi:hypothetical protein